MFLITGAPQGSKAEIFSTVMYRGRAYVSFQCPQHQAATEGQRATAVVVWAGSALRGSHSDGSSISRAVYPPRNFPHRIWSAGQGTSLVTLLSFHPQFLRARSHDVALEESPAYGDGSARASSLGSPVHYSRFRCYWERKSGIRFFTFLASE